LPLQRHLTPRRAAIAAGVLLLALFLGIDRLASISCRGVESCVTLRGLRNGVPLPEATRLYDGAGGVLAEVAGPLRHSLAHEEIPELLADAFVAVEDRRFWDHSGVDALGVLRAAVRNVTAGEIEEGASTIPMQLVRTLWAEPLRDVGSWRRKLIEARTAPKLIEDLGHERVLDLYLNAIYMGNGIYGVERAAEHYFGVGVDSLSLGQVATLVGMTRSPGYYDPYLYPDRALAVRNLVLDALVDGGVAAPSQADSARAAGLDLAATHSLLDQRRQRTHLTAAIMRELRRVAPDLAGQPGLGLRTSIDPLMQDAGEAALEAQAVAIESGRYGPFDPGDPLTKLEAAAVALEPSTGEVLAWIGGRDFDKSEFDRVELASRQVGSLIKPFLVATALEDGYAITDLVSADTVPIATDAGPWLPADHVDETVLPLREALVRSSNRAAAHLGTDLGLDRVARMAERSGLGESIPRVASISIGAFDASLLEVTAAYAPFGNGGLEVEAHLIQSIEGNDGTVLWTRAEPEGDARVIDPRTAFVVLDAMRAVVDRGTGYPVRAAGYLGPAAGKTGTTNEGRDAWFVGLTPAVVAGVWIGFDRPREIVRGRGGGDLAAPAWAVWMRALERSPRSIRAAWIPPSGVERVRYDATTGEVADFSCDAQLAAGFYEAWVHVGRYAQVPCERPSWLRRAWRAIVPSDPEPLTPVRRRAPRLRDPV
jgi:penicillin-binding protein 1A